MPRWDDQAGQIIIIIIMIIKMNYNKNKKIINYLIYRWQKERVDGMIRLGREWNQKKTNLGLTNASLFLALRASKRDIRQQLLGLIFDVLNFLI